jgi:hypothetical protein
MDREALGRLVRETWVQWAREQPDPKPSWLVPWEQLDEGQREVDCRIGEAVAAAEREQIAGLAEQHDVFYLVPVVSQGTPEHPGGIYDRTRPFADLIREGGTDG